MSLLGMGARGTVWGLLSVRVLRVLRSMMLRESRWDGRTHSWGRHGPCRRRHHLIRIHHTLHSAHRHTRRALLLLWLLLWVWMGWRLLRLVRVSERCPMRQSLIQAVSKTLQSEGGQRIHSRRPAGSPRLLRYPIDGRARRTVTTIHHLLHVHWGKRRHLHWLGSTVRKRGSSSAQLLLLGKERNIGNAIPRCPCYHAILHPMLLGECVRGKR
jgi:hypothetical protein